MRGLAKEANVQRYPVVVALRDAIIATWGPKSLELIAAQAKEKAAVVRSSDIYPCFLLSKS